VNLAHIFKSYLTLLSKTMHFSQGDGPCSTEMKRRRSMAVAKIE